jgi:nitroreductase
VRLDCPASPKRGQQTDFALSVVTDKETRSSLADIYRRGARDYFETLRKGINDVSGDPKKQAGMKRMFDSGLFLYDHFHEVPVHVVPCISGRTDNAQVRVQDPRWGSIFPALWSFMLAGKARGLGTTITTLHLNFEEEAAAVLGIPFREVMQACLLPVAYVKEEKEFKTAQRRDAKEVIHWERW